jgi:hypothetical protein
MCKVKTAKKGCSNSSTAELNTLWYVGFQPFSFLSYYFLEFYDFIFYFQETYNIWLKERYENDPDLWLEAGSSGEPDRNWMYGLSNTMAENL